MMKQHFLKAGGAALTLALLTAGATAVQSRTAVEASIKQAESDARNAGNALAKRNAGAAVRYAEHAVALRPQDATYRALLGRAYLAAGRFMSAKQAFADALQLDAGQAGAALNYALAATATGDYATAQQVLDANAATIAPADRGLAVALAGNPAAGVEILLAAARQPDVNAKTRQNLALTLALAGRWAEARQVALADLSPSDADARIVQWAAFAQPSAASDQVASLLGVTPVADAGVPAQLALVGAPAQIAEAAPAATQVPATPVETAVWQPDTPAPEAPAAEAPAAPVAVAAAEPAPQPQVSTIVFGERREVVQAIPARALRVAKPAPVRVAAAQPAPAASAKGNFYVQLGAFRGNDAARAAWNRARADHGALSGRTPSTMAAGNGLIRVSVGGYARADADALCRSVKANGGACFVRAGAGDRIAAWGAGGRTQLAAR